MNLTRPNQLTEADRDAIIEAMKEHGAQMTVQDPRFNQIRDWILSAVGAGILALGGYLVHSVDTLNQTMVKYITIQEYNTKALEVHTAELMDHDIRLTRIEAKK